MAMLGAFALWSAGTVSAAPPAGTEGAHPLSNPIGQSAVLPSIEILFEQSNLAGRCNGSTFDLNTFINATPETSASVRVSSSATNPMLLEQFTDTTGTNVGLFNDVYANFHILPFGGGLAPNTPITITITTYPGLNLTGTATFTSSITFNCTTGAIVKLATDPPPPRPAIPTLSGAGIALLMMLLGLLGAVAARARLAKGCRRL